MTKETRTCAACVGAGLGMLSLAVPAVAQPEYRVRAVAEFGGRQTYSTADNFAISGGEVRAELRREIGPSEWISGIYAGTSLANLRTILEEGLSVLPLPDGGTGSVSEILDAAFAPGGLALVAAVLQDGRHGLWTMNGPAGHETFSPVLITGEPLGGSTVAAVNAWSLRVHDTGVIAAMVYLASGEPVVVAGTPEALRVAVRPGQVLPDGTIIQTLGGPLPGDWTALELPMWLASDGSVRTVVTVSDGTPDAEEATAVVVEAGEGPRTLVRTVSAGSASAEAQRPFEIHDVRATSDGSLSLVGPVSHANGGFVVTVWSVTPDGEVTLGARNSELGPPYIYNPKFSHAENPSPQWKNIGFVPFAGGDLAGIVTDSWGINSFLARVRQGNAELLTFGLQEPSPLFRGAFPAQSYVEFAAEPGGGFLTDWGMGLPDRKQGYAVWAMNLSEQQSRIVVRQDRPLLAGPGLRFDNLLGPMAWFPASTGGDGRGQRIDADGRAVFTAYPYVLYAEPVGDCPQDVNDDGTVDVHDLLDYLGRFRIGENYAEWTRDFDITVADLLAFLGDFRRGCPEEPVQEMRPTRAR